MHNAEARLHSCLTRLAPHLDLSAVALTGGVAIDLHLGMGSRPYDDVDFVAARGDAVRPGVTADFLVSHFHTPHVGYAKFLIQLVDPESRMRVDVFSDPAGSLARAEPRDVAGVSLLVLDARTIFDHKLAMLARASAAFPVDEKHYRHAMLLSGNAIAAIPATHLCHVAYSQDLDAVCSRCAISRDAAYPLAPKRDIFRVLGYV